MGCGGEVVTRAANSNGLMQQRQQEELLQQLHLLEKVNTRVVKTPRMVGGRRTIDRKVGNSEELSCIRTTE